MLSGLEDHGNQTSCPCIPVFSECETKSGQLHMIHKLDNNGIVKLSVQLSAYKNGYGHYAVINADKTHTNKSVHVNLKNCFVNQTDAYRINLITNNADGTTITFQTQCKQQTSEWLNILQNDVVMHDSNTRDKDLTNICDVMQNRMTRNKNLIKPRSPLQSVSEIEEEE